MKSELIKQFIKKMSRKIVAFIFLMFIITAIGQSIAPTVTNSVALTQMENSDMPFAIMNTYTKIQPVFSFIYYGIIVWFVCGIGRDIYKFTKTLSAENTEN